VSARDDRLTPCGAGAGRGAGGGASRAGGASCVRRTESAIADGVVDADPAHERTEAEGKTRRRDGRPGGAITAHGFCNTFRDRADETMPYPCAVLEMALAHAPHDKAEAAMRAGRCPPGRALIVDRAAHRTRQPGEGM